MLKYKKIKPTKDIEEKIEILTKYNGKQVLAQVDELESMCLGGMLIYGGNPGTDSDVYFLHGNNGEQERFAVRNLGTLLVQLQNK